jgi:hypothetical protein
LSAAWNGNEIKSGYSDLLQVNTEEPAKINPLVLFFKKTKEATLKVK